MSCAKLVDPFFDDFVRLAVADQFHGDSTAAVRRQLLCPDVQERTKKARHSSHRCESSWRCGICRRAFLRSQAKSARNRFVSSVYRYR